jgi:hypothetical protein
VRRSLLLDWLSFCCCGSDHLSLPASSHWLHAQVAFCCNNVFSKDCSLKYFYKQITVLTRSIMVSTTFAVAAALLLVHELLP